MSLEEPIIESFEVGGFVKIAAVFLLGLMLLSGFGTAISNANPKSATITLNEIPQAGDTVTLGAHVFEFTNSGTVADGNIPVTIGSTLYETGNNLKNAMTSNTDFTVQ
jgi:hypothetical protein